MSDELDYDELGWNLAKVGKYLSDGEPTAYRAIGYPAAIAIVYWFGGRHPTNVKIAQAALDAGTAILLSCLLLRRSRKAALAAGVIWCVFPAAILFSNQMFSESVFAFGLALFTLALDRTFASGRRSAWALGILLGCLVLLKPTMIVFAALLPVALSPVRPGPFSLRIFAWACLPIALWVGRNALVMHAPVITTSTGRNLLIGNNPAATGGYSTVDGRRTQSSMGEVRDDADALHTATNFILRNPIRTLSTGARKVGLLMSSDGELAVGHFARAPAELSARFRDRFRTVPTWILFMVSAPTALVLILGTLGLATRSSDVISRLFWALLFTTAATSVVFFGGSRFRFPLMVFLVAFAGEFLVEPRARFARLTGVRSFLATIAISVCALAWITELIVIYRH